jgi:hypothetical protein
MRTTLMKNDIALEFLNLFCTEHMQGYIFLWHSNKAAYVDMNTPSTDFFVSLLSPEKQSRSTSWAKCTYIEIIHSIGYSKYIYTEV